MRRLHLLMGAWIAAILVVPAGAQDWITARSTYTHDPASGSRVVQYAEIPPVYTYPRADYRSSGYRHTRSSIRAGGSADHLHVVEEWGRPVRPYGEWLFPYRPYSVPYDLWGPPAFFPHLAFPPFGRFPVTRGGHGRFDSGHGRRFEHGDRGGFGHRDPHDDYDGFHGGGRRRGHDDGDRGRRRYDDGDRDRGEAPGAARVRPGR